MTWKQILDALEADIVCFQEVKISRETAGKYPDMVMVPGYDSFFSFCPQRPGQGGGGYSGIATFVRTERIPTPVDAEEGFLNVIRNKAPSRIGHYGDLDMELTMEEMQALDGEGRCVITDHRLFVLFNVYFPNDSGTEERHVYKMKFHRAIESRVRALLAGGRQVIVVGDINTTHTELDHADPKKSMKDLGVETFLDVPSRKWIHRFLVPNGPMVDTFRKFHPNRQGAFTCWNTKIDARAANYGTRIDYVLVSEGLSDYVMDADVHQKIIGSDHCPVSATFRDEIVLDERGRIATNAEGTLKRLVDLMDPSGSFDPNAPSDPPALCSCYWDEFSGKQKKLSSFFSAAVKTVVQESEGAKVESCAAPDSPPVEAAVNGAISSADAAPRKGSFSEPVAVKKEVASWTSSKKSKKGAAPAAKKKNSVSLQGQTSLLSFLGKNSGPPVATASPASQESEPSAPEPITTGPEYIVVSDTNEPASPSAPPEPLSAAEFAFVSNEPVVKNAWSTIFQPKPTPLCWHGEATKEWVTNKPGPNKGRAFYLCQRPVGPEEEGTEKGVFGSKKRKGLKIGQYKCDFFAWKKSARRDGDGDGESETKRTKTEGPVTPKSSAKAGSSQELVDEWPSDVELADYM